MAHGENPMLTHALAYLAGAGTLTLIAVTLGARWRQKRRRVDELHAAMLLAVWDVQDAAAWLAVEPSDDARFADWQANRKHRNTAARRYFAAVGE